MGMSATGGQFVDEFAERGQFTLIDQIELLYEEYEVFERRVEVRLFAQLHHFLEVLVIYMGVDSEQTLQYCLRYGVEVSRKRNSYFGWEQGLII